MQTYDVVIMGAGIAGGLFARQLRLDQPELTVLVLEARPEMDDLKVGESTVEVAANYMVRRLHLGAYLYQHQLPKNGLRFFFDSPDKDLPLTAMSEIGSDHMPFHPSFQLERARLERDLVTMNRQAGADVRLGARVVEVAVEGRGPHRVAWEEGGERREARARWLVDASGRRQLLHRALGNPIHKETRLNTGAAWARYRNVAGLDAVRDEAFRGRVRYTSRHLSTNHMMYDGYWIWFIPLAGDLMSVGVVFDKDRVKGPRTREELEAFLAEHRSSRDLMQGAVFEDFQAYAHLPYHADAFFSADRWATIGEAGAFVDPFYSPGSDFIATANELTGALIRADVAGEELAERVDLFTRYYTFKYETTLALYARLYPIFGSYEVFRLKYLLDFHNYYNLVVWPYMADKLTDTAWLKEELDFAPRVLTALGRMADHFVAMAENLREKGQYHRMNQGRWANGLCGVAQFEQRLGPVLDEAFRRAEVGRAFGHVYASIVESVLGHEGLSKRERFLSELGFPAVLYGKAIDEAVLARLLRRSAERVARELRAEVPGVAFDRVVVEPSADDLAVRVLGLDETGPDAERVRLRARELWEAEGQSLTHVAL